MTEHASGGRAADGTTGLLCPSCRVDLVMSERQGVEIDYCPRCRGVWLDRGELDKILERSATELAAAQPPRPQAPPPQPPPPIDHRRALYDTDEHRYDGYGHKKHRRRSFLDDLFD